MTVRNIITTYFDKQGKEVRVNRSCTPRAASKNAFDHMQVNQYSADTAVVHDDNMGELHVIFTLDMNGDVHTAFKRSAKTPTCIVVPHGESE